MSTIDNIFVLNGHITHCINSSEYLYCCFVDFTQAFDYVERDILWYKLIKIGIRGHMLDIIKSMYNTVKSRVKNNNNVCRPKVVTSAHFIVRPIVTLAVIFQNSFVEARRIILKVSTIQRLYVFMRKTSKIVLFMEKW